MGDDEFLLDDLMNMSWPCLTMPNLSLCDEQNSTQVPPTTLPAAGKELVFIDVFWAVVAAIVCIVTVGGNALVILSFFLERNLRVPSNYFICSLAVSDLLIGLFSAPLYTMYLVIGWPLGEFLCDLWLSLDYTVCLTSQYTVFFITLDRFLSVTKPAKYRNWRTHQKMSVMVAISWVLPSVIFFTVIFGWQYFVGIRTVPDKDCYAQFTEDAIFSTILAIGYYWITLVVMCFLYAGIYRVALRLQKRSNAKRKKAAKLVSVAGAEMSRIGVSFAQQPAEEPTPMNNGPVKQSQSQQGSPIKESRTTTGSDSDGGGSTSERKKQEKIVACETSFIQSPLPRRAPPMTSPNDDGGVYTGPAVVRTILPSRETVELKEDEDMSLPNDPSDYFLCYPAERIHGVRFVDQDSLISSIASTENIRLLSDLHRYSNKREGGGGSGEHSPVWKRRFPSIRALQTVDENSITPDDKSTKEDQQQMQPVSNGPVRHQSSIKSEKTTISYLKSTFETRMKGAITRRFMRNRQSAIKMSKGENRARKALRTITFILGIFVLCWTPYHIAVVIAGFCADCVGMTFYSITYWFCYLNSPVNPFCYALVNVMFKKTFLRILKGDLRRK